MYTTRPLVTGKNGVIATGHYLATLAGLKMFARGGNAVDAGVAAGFALAVLKPRENTLGGECPILIYSPRDRTVRAISGQGTAAHKATVSWFEEQNISMIPGDGFLGAVVPGLVGAYATALLHFGRLGLEETLTPAIELAAEGIPVYPHLLDMIESCKTRFAEVYPTTGAVFLPGGNVPRLGQMLKQPALAATLSSLVEAEKGSKSEGREKAIQRGIEQFYKGDVAEKILRYARNNPVIDQSGKSHSTLLEIDDFRSYTTRVEEPVFADYKDCRVYKCGPWTQGPVFLHQLKLLEGFDLVRMGHNTAAYIHTVVECAKLAFEAREKYYGDPEFSDIPIDTLLSQNYNDQLRSRISPDRANLESYVDSIYGSHGALPPGDTSHLDVIDSEGLMMSATPSGAWIPSSPIIPELGFPLGTRGQIFNLQKGHPNCLEPGKRPRTTLTPSLAFKKGRPWMVFGTPGGDTQDQTTLQFFLNVVEFNMDLQRAIDQPAVFTKHLVNSFYPHEFCPGVLCAEPSLGTQTFEMLAELGHKLEILPSRNDSAVNAVAINHDNALIEGAASSKYDCQSYAMGW